MTALIACSLAVALVPGASAHHASVFEHGRLIVDLDESGGDCAITVTGRHVGASEGTLRFFAAPEGPEGEQLLLEVDVEATPEDEGAGWTFVAGPFSDFGFDDPDWVTFYFEADGDEHAVGILLDFDGCRNVDMTYAYDPETMGPPGCTFVIEGAHLVSPEGYVSVRDSARNEVMRIDLEPTPEANGEGWEFVTDPITLEKDDRYNVRFVYTGNDTTFRSSLPDGFRVTGCGPDRAAPDECGVAEQARALEGGSIELEWLTPELTEGTRIERASGEGSFETIAVVETGEHEVHTYVDTDTQPGETYRYRIVPFNDAGDASEECEILEVTAVPFFGAPLLGVLALVGGVGAYAWLARRRA